MSYLELLKVLSKQIESVESDQSDNMKVISDLFDLLYGDDPIESD